jgi:tRNA G18 (ribose-2'-O)-methylase SpoU
LLSGIATGQWHLTCSARGDTFHCASSQRLTTSSPRVRTDCPLIGVEMGGTALTEFRHPERAIYLLGAEDHGLPKPVRDKCQSIVSLQSINQESYNVAVAGSLVMYHRRAARNEFPQ